MKGEVEIDEFWLGGYEEGLKGSRQRGKKALVGVAIEVRGAGSGRLGLQMLPDSSSPTLRDFTVATTAAGAIVHTDALASLPGPFQARLRPPPPATERRRSRASSSYLAGTARFRTSRAWMHGTHHGVSDEHLPVYLDEYVRHEALSDRVGCKAPPLGCRSGPVKLRAA